MSAFPSLPLFVDAFLADTGHLDAQQSGAYLLLLMVAWRSSDCVLPDDDERLAKWARVDPRTWRRIKSKVMEFWSLVDGQWSQKRLSKEWQIVSKRAEVARANGKQSAGAKPLKSQQAGNPAGSPWVSQPPTPSPNPSEAAAAGPRARPAISKQALDFADELARIAGHDPGILPPEWVSDGPALRVQMMLDAGWRVDVMRDTAKAVMRRPRRRQPRRISYFEPIFAEAHAPPLPLPAAQVVHTTESPHGKPKPSSDYRSSKDGWRRAHAALKANIAGADEPAGNGEASGGEVVRFSAAAGRGRP